MLGRRGDASSERWGADGDGLGIEAHKGGALITPGDNQDICVTSWLAGSTNQMACGLAVGFPMIPQDASVQ